MVKKRENIAKIPDDDTPSDDSPAKAALRRQDWSGGPALRRVGNFPVTNVSGGEVSASPSQRTIAGGRYATIAHVDEESGEVHRPKKKGY